MLKKSITFADLDGNPVTEDFYFNLTKAEIAELELSAKGGLSSYLEQIIETEDGDEIIRLFKKIIGMSIGRRSEDNRRFVKNEQIRDEFFQTEAYSELFMEMITNPQSMADFIKGVAPADMDKVLQQTTVGNRPVQDAIPAWVQEDREPTKEEVMSMSKEELAEAFRRRAERSKTDAPAEPVTE